MLVAENGRAKIGDLGLSQSHAKFDVKRITRVIDRRDSPERLTWVAAGGTAEYMSPRVIAEYRGNDVSPPGAPRNLAPALDAADNGRPERPPPGHRRQQSSGSGLWPSAAHVDELEQPGTCVINTSEDGGGTAVVDLCRAANRMRANDDVNSPDPDGRRPLGIWHAPDAYSFGIILWQVLTTSGAPWEGLDKMDIWMRVQQGKRPPVTEADETCAPEGYVALMRELWHQDPVKRPTFAEALQRLRGMAEARRAAEAASLAPEPGARHCSRGLQSTHVYTC